MHRDSGWLRIERQNVESVVWNDKVLLVLSTQPTVHES
jgi:hypothetical protein